MTSKASFLVCLAYLGMSFALLATTVSIDAFAIFHEPYWLVAFAILPGMFTAGIWVLHFRRRGRVLGVVFATCGILGLTALHFWLVLEFAKGV